MKRLISLMLILTLAAAVPALSETAVWDCPNCGRTGNEDNFCPSCGQARPDGSPDEREDGSAGDRDAQLRRAIAAYDEKDYETAFPLLLSLADEGDADAQWRVGVMYDDGNGVAENDALAFEYTRSSAMQGNSDGQWRLGILYEYGRGVKSDDVMAAVYYTLSAEQGNTSGLYFLGFMYRHGRGVQKDVDRAIDCYRRAAEKGNASSASTLGYMYELGEDVEQDYETALMYYEMALENTAEDSYYYSWYQKDVEDLRQKIALLSDTPTPAPTPVPTATPTPNPTPSPSASTGIRPYLQDLNVYSKGAFNLTGPDLSRTIYGDRFDWPNNGGRIIDQYVQALVDSGNFRIVDVFDDEQEYGGWNPYSMQGTVHYRFYEVALEYTGTEQLGARIGMNKKSKSGHVVIRYGYQNSDVKNRLTIQYSNGIDLIDLGYRYGSPKPVTAAAATPNPRPTVTAKPTPKPIANPQHTVTMSVGERREFTFNRTVPDYERINETFQWSITSGAGLAKIENANSRTCTVTALKAGTFQLDCTYVYSHYDSDVLTGNWEYKTENVGEGFVVTVK